MNWTIELAAVLLTTTFTGSIAFGVWYVTGKLMDLQGNAVGVRRGLWAVMFAYLAPVGFVILMWLNDNRLRWGGVLFWPTPVIVKISEIFVFCWLAGACLMGANFLSELIRQSGKCQRGMPCEAAVREIFEKVCRELGVSGKKVKLLQCYEAAQPEFVGLLRPKVLLPAEEFGERELYVIFSHELFHYKQKDHFLKYLVQFLKMTQFFNPLVWRLEKTVNRWNEYSCDIKASKRTGGVRAYFEVVLHLAERRKDGENASSLYLAGKRPPLLERLTHLISYEKVQRTGKKKRSPVILTGMAGILCGGFLMTLTLEAAAWGYRGWFVHTEAGVKEEAAVDTTEYNIRIPLAILKEHDKNILPVLDENGEFVFTSGQQETVSAGGESYGRLSGILEGGSRKRTGKLYLKQGQSLLCMLLDETKQKNLQIGIMDDTGRKQYALIGKPYEVTLLNSARPSAEIGEAHCHFEIEETGYYALFAENPNQEPVEMGSFHYFVLEK